MRRVALLVETDRAYGRGLLRGIARWSHLHGPWSFYADTGTIPTTVPRLRDWGCQGIIARVVNPSMARAMRDEQLAGPVGHERGRPGGNDYVCLLRGPAGGGVLREGLPSRAGFDAVGGGHRADRGRKQGPGSRERGRKGKREKGGRGDRRIALSPLLPFLRWPLPPPAWQDWSMPG